MMQAYRESTASGGAPPCERCGHRRIFHHVMVTERGDRRERPVPCSIPDCRCHGYAASTTEVDDFQRQLRFDGCYNFRDLGRYATADGRWTRAEMLYRADGPHALTEADERRLADLGLTTLIDLRTTEEVERGCYSNHVRDVVRHHLPMLDVVPDADDIAGWVDQETVARRYREMLDNAADKVARILTILSDERAYPVLFHCSAGKDRTGIVSAILLGLVNVPDETIVADYALSEASMRHLVAYYQSTYPDAREQLDRLAPAMIAASPETMRHFLRGLRDDYGTFDAYAERIGAGAAPPRIRDAVLTA
jgi:protein tyrosine/serine phosphatase